MEDTKELDFSVVIPAYNEEKYLPKTLRHLLECFNDIPDKSGEIIVVDNHSNDQTEKVAKEFGAVVCKESLRSISRARNRGAAEAKGKILIFNDADTLVPCETLKSALRVINEPSCCGGGAFIKFDENHGKFFFGEMVPSFWNFISRSLKLAAGSFIFCRSFDFEKAGGFPEKIYAGEEIYFCMALKKSFRHRKSNFIIFEAPPVITSSRKLLWHGNLKMFSVLLTLFLFPFANRYKRLCNFWYDRPS